MEPDDGGAVRHVDRLDALQAPDLFIFETDELPDSFGVRRALDRDCPLSLRDYAHRVTEPLIILAGKYYEGFGDAVSVIAEGERTITIQGTTDAERIRELVGLENEEVRSLKSVEAIDVSDGSTVVRLHEPVEPEMYPAPDGRQVKCLLFRPDVSPPTGNA